MDVAHRESTTRCAATMPSSMKSRGGAVIGRAPQQRDGDRPRVCGGREAASSPPRAVDQSTGPERPTGKTTKRDAHSVAFGHQDKPRSTEPVIASSNTHGSKPAMAWAMRRRVLLFSAAVGGAVDGCRDVKATDVAGWPASISPGAAISRHVGRSAAAGCVAIHRAV